MTLGTSIQLFRVLCVQTLVQRHNFAAPRRAVRPARVPTRSVPRQPRVPRTQAEAHSARAPLESARAQDVPRAHATGVARAAHARPLLPMACRPACCPCVQVLDVEYKGG
jgi:hypothetical protein